LADDLLGCSPCHLLGDALFLERLDEVLLERYARAHGLGRGDLVQAVLAGVDTPVPLEALRRDARAYRAAKGHALGKARIVAIEQRRGIKSTLLRIFSASWTPRFARRPRSDRPSGWPRSLRTGPARTRARS